MSFLRAQPDIDVQQRCVAQLTAQASSSAEALQELIDLGAVGLLARTVYSCKTDAQARSALRLLSALTDLPAGLAHAAQDPLFLKAILGALVTFAHADTRRACLQCAGKVAAAIDSISSEVVDGACLAALVAYISADGLDAMLAVAIVHKLCRAAALPVAALLDAALPPALVDLLFAHTSAAVRTQEMPLTVLQRFASLLCCLHRTPSRLLLHACLARWRGRSSECSCDLCACWQRTIGSQPS
jgi:hypothetical protein